MRQRRVNVLRTIDEKPKTYPGFSVKPDNRQIKHRNTAYHPSSTVNTAYQKVIAYSITIQDMPKDVLGFSPVGHVLIQRQHLDSRRHSPHACLYRVHMSILVKKRDASVIYSLDMSPAHERFGWRRRINLVWRFQDHGRGRTFSCFAKLYNIRLPA
jgi:hypothetical protein